MFMNLLLKPCSSLILDDVQKNWILKSPNHKKSFSFTLKSLLKLSVWQFQFWLHWGFLCTFYSLQKMKKILKSLQRKRRNCKRTKTIILTVFMLKLKNFIINFSFQKSTETIVDQKKPIWYIFFNFYCIFM